MLNAIVYLKILNGQFREQDHLYPSGTVVRNTKTSTGRGARASSGNGTGYPSVLLLVLAGTPRPRSTRQRQRKRKIDGEKAKEKGTLVEQSRKSGRLSRVESGTQVCCALSDTGKVSVAQPYEYRRAGVARARSSRAWLITYIIDFRVREITCLLVPSCRRDEPLVNVNKPRR